MNRLPSSIASAFELARRIANPPISSFTSANGPSVTVSLPFEARIFAPLEVG
jgi:hypothetical protein